MENKILEIKNYFLNKITACDFKIITLEKGHNNWLRFIVQVDDLYMFVFSIEPKLELYCQHSGSFMQIEIPDDRLNNLIKFIDNYENELRKQKISELESKLSELKSQIY